MNTAEFGFWMFTPKLGLKDRKRLKCPWHDNLCGISVHLNVELRFGTMKSGAHPTKNCFNNSSIQSDCV